MDDFVQDTADMERDLRRRSRLLPVGIALILLSAFGAVVWFAFAAPMVAPEEQQTVELIQADPEPIKTKPEDPGGMKVQHQDKLILNPDPEKPQIERLLPPPEAPVPVEAPVEEAGAPQTETADNATDTPDRPAQVVVTEEVQTSASSALEEGGRAAEEAAEAVGNAAASAGDRAGEAGKQIAEKAESALNSVAKKPAGATSQTKADAPTPPKDAVVTPKPVAKPAPVAKPSSAAKTTSAAQVAQVPRDSGYVLQLASLRSDADARSEWTRIQRQNRNLLAQMKPIVEKAEIEGVGTRYRLQTGPFPTKATAQDLCAQLKAAKQDCLVKRR